MLPIAANSAAYHLAPIGATMKDDIDDRLYNRWNETIEFKEIVLEKLALMVEIPIDKYLLEDICGPRSMKVVERIAGEFSLNLRQEILGKTLERKSVEYPATWKDNVKIAFYAWLGWPGSGHWPWLADYARKRWPIRYEQITMEAWALYPKLSFTHREQESHIKYIVQKTNEWR